VTDKGIAPEQILVLTFSTEAADELRERIGLSLGEEVGARVMAMTFHGFGVVLLNVLGHHIGLDVDFAILDDASQEEMLTEIVGEIDCEALIDIKDPTRTAVHVVQQINYLKDRLIGPNELRAALDEWQPTDDDEDAYNRSVALLRLFE